MSNIHQCSPKRRWMVVKLVPLESLFFEGYNGIICFVNSLLFINEAENAHLPLSVHCDVVVMRRRHQCGLEAVVWRFTRPFALFCLISCHFWPLSRSQSFDICHQFRLYKSVHTTGQSLFIYFVQYRRYFFPSIFERTPIMTHGNGWTRDYSRDQTWGGGVGRGSG